ncbi:TIGR03668 family PPOX class F420-dependent oxidoreductase [Actinomadura sp. ATCC 31491]|uniref:TIGR03668 family PPOX class F420-dependent oxidoreductase n=1 Tax=Actinomadura luzonensis TaxID=2805427 RepID=A0ABT0FPN1_9ACTN|nr:TIGR03668 family PPOX class F420-dependent oxidoreductase [Actinomadura luzonensis]MCK2214313.1 TIGR03668 family PPOX class F420-dependent oxidoreductase [Actinomadura luzonensis]
MEPDRARALFANERIACLATASAGAVPHVVPVTFALVDDQIVIAIDHKPKRSTNLRRLRNIHENPQVSLLADYYDDDWSRLWWVRADGAADIHEDGPERERALEALAAKYEQYRQHIPAGPVIVTSVGRWSGWAYTE